MHTKQLPAALLLVIALLTNSCNHAEVKVGSLSIQLADKWIPCSGHVIVAQENRIGIPAPAAGKIISVSYPAGHFVTSESEMATLENADFIWLQQEYLDAANQFEYLREEFARQGELTIENATSMKKMQIAKRDFQSAEYKLQALRSQLEILGICADSVKFDNLTSVITILTPGAGTISKSAVHLGSYVEKGEELFEITTMQPLLVELNVPEQYIQYLQKGQNLDFWPVYDSLITYKAQVFSISREIKTDSHTASVFAKVSGLTAHLIQGMSINGRIFADKDTVMRINSNAIVHNTKGSFMYIKKNGIYTSIPIIQGKTNGEMTEISGFPHEISDSVVIQGVELLHSEVEQH